MDSKDKKPDKRGDLRIVGLSESEKKDFDDYKKLLGDVTNAEALIESIYAGKRILPVFGAIEKKIDELGVKLDLKFGVQKLILTPNTKLGFKERLAKYMLLGTLILDFGSVEQAYQYALALESIRENKNKEVK